MTKRNIAIANFTPGISVINSSWPRFTGFKFHNREVKPTKLFGLVDGNTRMHAFFKDTTIEEVLVTKLRYIKITRDVVGVPTDMVKGAGGAQTIILPSPSPTDTTIYWMEPHTYTDKDGMEWDVYPVVTGEDIHIKGTADNNIATHGFWDMGIWQPKATQLDDDVYRIEQATINHVVKLGHPAMDSITMFKDSPDYNKYKVVNVVVELP